ncbi:MAG TPA: proton-conducting transporter membrane subunit [Nitrospiria bacterium]|nr:proton-conducting transporter membrane subunit [Nitrospiria bacterium]
MSLALLILIAAPLAAGLASLRVPTRRAMERLQLANAAVLWAAMAAVVAGVGLKGAVSFGALLRADPLSAFMDVMLAFIGGTALCYAVGYMGEELTRGHLGFLRYRRFFVYFDLFLFAMMLAVNLDNIALMWIAVEASTISAALSVGFDRTKAALEAGWKYIILNFVGIALALFGTVLVYYTAEHALGVSMDALSWTALHRAAGSTDGGLNPVVLKMAFVFAMIGYGTKAGVAPMHTWLPDAHAEAPTPTSAMLSGLMLNLGLYAVLRLKGLIDPAVGPAFTGSIMLGMGLLSMAIAAAFMLIQRDYKRLLGYSSVEHVGIALIGFGVGGPLGLFGGLFHMLNHALAKSAAFYAAGMVLLRHGHKMIERVTGLVRLAPAAGSGLLLAAVALAGLPPFGLFVSELLIAAAAYRHHQGIALLFLGLLALAFATLLAPLTRMTFAEPIHGDTVQSKPIHDDAVQDKSLHGGAAHDRPSEDARPVTAGPDRLMLSALGINLAAMSVTGLLLPIMASDWLLPVSALLDAKAGLP